MAEFTPISYWDLIAKINSIDSAIVDLTAEREHLSFLAASGDAEAVQKLDKIDKHIAQHQHDRGVLESARAEALRRDKAAAAEQSEKERQARLAAARVAAKELVKVCARVDVMAAEFADLFGQINDLERTVRNEGRGGGASVDGTTFQNGLALSALAHFTCVNDFSFRRPDRSLHDAAMTAWGKLLAGEE